ncbi:MAG: NUDIX hydrolase [Gammaproteobacteria bacterium SG8_11]|nr:MAG: NUDIX hydrolase [Gammaproteobacteria bacterium SG8_11]
MPTPTTPLIAVDIIIELIDRDDRPIVLIERKNPPYGWAIPGGFVDVGETLEQAAVREAKEETCLDVSLSCLLGNYSDPGRDSRHHTVSAVYIAQAKGEPKAADDAAHLELFSPHKLPETLAFDHNKILTDYIRYLNTGRSAPLP